MPPTQQSLIEQKRKLTAWSKYFSANSQVVNLVEKNATQNEENRIAVQDHNQFLVIKLTTMDNLQLPVDHASEVDRVKRFEYKVMARITLYSLKNGFFGRTY